MYPLGNGIEPFLSLTVFILTTCQIVELFGNDWDNNVSFKEWIRVNISDELVNWDSASLCDPQILGPVPLKYIYLQLYICWDLGIKFKILKIYLLSKKIFSTDYRLLYRACVKAAMITADHEWCYFIHISSSHVMCYSSNDAQTVLLHVNNF